jgi:hypothetical protein
VLTQRREFQVGEFLEACAFDGGYDFTGTGLTLEDLVNVWNGASDVSWRELGFFASETLAYYSVLGRDFKPEHIPRWLFLAMLLREAAQREEADWEFSINVVLRLLVLSVEATLSVG